MTVENQTHEVLTSVGLKLRWEETGRHSTNHCKFFYEGIGVNDFGVDWYWWPQACSETRQASYSLPWLEIITTYDCPSWDARAGRTGPDLVVC